MTRRVQEILVGLEDFIVYSRLARIHRLKGSEQCRIVTYDIENVGSRGFGSISTSYSDASRHFGANKFRRV
jgi:hypothetical protein